MVLKIHKNKSIDENFLLGERSDTIVNQLCATFLAISPILQHYIGLYRNAGFTLLLLVFPFIMLRGLLCIAHRHANTKCLTAVFPIILFEIYTIASHSLSFNSVIYGLFMTVFFIALSTGAVNVKVFFRTTLLICKVATMCLIVQYLSYYLLHRHIQMVPVNLLLPGSDIWIERSIFGISKASELYRPSAFFLEPSHLFLYSFPVLCFLLLLPKPDGDRIKDAVILSIGMILSTSGFSVVIVAFLWSVYFIFYKNRRTVAVSISRLLSGRTVLVLSVFIIVLVAVYFTVPVFRDTVSRIFNIDNRTSVAISGRVRLANEYIKNLHGESLLFGASNHMDGFEFNMPGFHSTLYKWGIAGIILTYGFYGQGVFKLKNAYYYIALIIIAVSFFSAHTHGTFYMLYYSTFLVNGYYHDNNRAENSSNELMKYGAMRIKYD